MVINMEENKIISIICFCITIIFLFCSIISCDNEKLSLFYDISLGIFTGSLLSFITARISYYTLKEKKIRKLKEQIVNDIGKYREIIESIEYVFFGEKLEKELKENNVYYENELWFNSFVLSSNEIMKSNIRKLKKLKNISIEQIYKNIEELSSLKHKKEYKIKFDNIKKIILEIERLIDYCGYYDMQDKISYKEIQKMIYVNEDNEGNIIDNDIEVVDGDVYPTKKLNILKKEIVNFLQQL